MIAKGLIQVFAGRLLFNWIVRQEDDFAYWVFWLDSLAYSIKLNCADPCLPSCFY